MTGDRYGENTIIHLGYNNLTRFESTIFQAVAEQMASYADQKYTRIHLYGSKQFYIESDITIRLN